MVIQRAAQWPPVNQQHRSGSDLVLLLQLIVPTDSTFIINTCTTVATIIMSLLLAWED